jgi:hypothetical protein
MFARRVSARDRCPQIIAGSEVSPKVRRANTPSMKLQMGRAGNTSSEERNASGNIVEEELAITRL